MTRLLRRPAAILLLGLTIQVLPAAGADWDLLIRGARVIDPESGLNAIRDVAVNGGRIVAIADDLATNSGGADGDGAERVIDGTGQVLAPGFIDLHAHGASDRARDYQVRDGVTTALELEWGYPTVGAFLESRSGRSRVNFGASVSHGALRALALGAGEQREELRRRMAEAAQQPEPLLPLQGLTSDSFYAPLDSARRNQVAAEIRRGIREGGLGIGMAHAYYPGADRSEILEVFETAAALQIPIYTHARGLGLDAVQEVLANAAATGAALHIVHINSTTLGEIEPALRLIRSARLRGVDVTTEAYPYTAASTLIQSSLFDGDWQSAYGISYDGLQWQATGERLTEQSFNEYRRQGGVLIIHMMRDGWIDQALDNDWVMVASDGMPYDPGAHPRTAGTFARVLGHYVRERGLIDLPTAIGKMTLLPARRLESIAPQMANKGRVQVGMDADLVLFDPQRVIDTATFESGPSFSEGIEYVFVGGIAVVDDGALVPGAFPGQAIRGQLPGAAQPGP
jgi:cytosine/adenosine deaminase-related metal-dependent hydrolase